MCGLVGIAGKLEFKDEATFKRLLIYDYFRGPDSTGIAALRGNGDIKIAKIASHPLDLFDMKKFTEAVSGYNSTVFLGHNRLATKGGVNNYNAHPYEFDHIVGAHNGTLDKSSWDALEAALDEKYEVDSMAIIAAIAKLGIEATVPLLQGAWALVWIDRSKSTLNFLRNKERPFWYAYTKNFDHLLWASEWPFIDAATKLSAQGYELHSDPTQGFKFWSTKEDWWYRYDLDQLKKGSEGRPKPRVKELKGKEPAPVVVYTGGKHPFHNHGTRQSEKKSTTTSLGTTHSSTNNKNPNDNVTVLHLVGTRDAPFGGHLTEEEFNKIAKYGCSWCQADIEFEEPGVKVFQAQDMILCPSCGGSEDTTRIYVEADRIVG